MASARCHDAGRHVPRRRIGGHGRPAGGRRIAGRPVGLATREGRRQVTRARSAPRMPHRPVRHGVMRAIAAAAAAVLLMGAWESAAAAADPAIPQSACLPENAPDSSGWPVKVIYLHGWFAPTGPTDIANN